MDYSTEINGYCLEFIEESHDYLVNGILVPSITTLLKGKFGRKYDGVSKAMLNRAAEQGTAVHEAIEQYCKDGTESELKEVRNFKFLQKQYGFEVAGNEIPVILFYDNKPIAAGRLDLVLKMGGEIGGADIKRTATLDKEYLAYQLNLYRLAYRQCYGIEWQFLRGVHLREDTRKFVNIPINEAMTIEFIKHYAEEA